MARKLESLIATGIMAGIAKKTKASKKRKSNTPNEQQSPSMRLDLSSLVVLSILGIIISYLLYANDWPILGLCVSSPTLVFIFSTIAILIETDKGKKNLGYSNPNNEDTNSETLIWKQKKARISIQSKNNKIVKDIDGNIYHTVTIGSQIWMLENLKTTKYRNGDLIGTTTPATLDISTEIHPKYQWSYNGDESNVNKYGRLYTWDVIVDNRNICPTGWHVPSNNEWELIVSELKGTNDIRALQNGSYDIIEGQFNIFLTGILSLVNNGFRSNNGKFEGLGTFGQWWILDEELTRDDSNAFAVRCVKD